jgi:hypothetical protein
MPARTKAYILTAVSILLPVAMYFVPYPHARILMGVVLAWHWWYFLFRVKTARPGAIPENIVGNAVNDDPAGKEEPAVRGESK